MFFDRRLWTLTRGLHGRMALGIGLGLLSLAAGIARFGFLGLLLAATFSAAPLATALQFAVAAVAAILLRAGLDHTRAVLAHRTAGLVQERLRERLHAQIVALGPGYFAQQRTGGVMLSVVDGVEQLQSYFGQFLPQLAIAAAAPFMIFAFIAFWDVPVALVLLAGAVVALLGPLAVNRRDGRASLARSRAFKSFGEEFLDAVQGLPTLKAFGQSGAFGEKLADKARALSDQTFWVLAVSVLTRFLVDLGTALGAAAALVLGAWRVRHGDMSLAALLVVLMAGTEIFRPLRDLRAILHQGLHGRSAAAGIAALLDAPSSLPPGGAGAADGLAPTLAFEDVAFAYPGTRLPALRGLSLSIGAGERVGIVGPSGSGKSSIVRLLLREYAPQSGTVRFGGRDVASLDSAALARRIAVVAQDTALFHGTVAENLRLGRPEASDAELRAAAQAANADGFIMALPGGYKAVIGERGTRLSGGQRQRIAIARALLLDAPVLILDEALSAVDAENETAIQQALDRLMLGRTTLILAHRLSSVIGADRILVLDHGNVVDSGSHASLIARDGLYRRLMGPQASERDGVGALLPATPAMPPGPGDRSSEEAISITADAASIGWRETLETLAGFIRPWRGRLALTVALGVGRVTGFIAVGALGALLVAAVRAGTPIASLACGLLLAAPFAALCHWLESWLAHAMAYQLLAEMRIALFATLDRLAPAYLLRRRAGDLVALATQDVETVEYFYAHTVAPSVVAVLVPLAVLAALVIAAWPLALALLPFLLYAMLAPLRGRARIDRLAAASRGALGMLGAHASETMQGLSELLAFQATTRRGLGFMALARQAATARLALLVDLSWQSVALEAATSLGGLAVAVLGAWMTTRGALAPGLLPLLVLLATAAFLPVSEIAQVSRQLADTIASTRRLALVSREPTPVTDGPVEPPATDGGASFAFDAVGFTYPDRTRPALTGIELSASPGRTIALVGASGAGKSTLANLLLRFWDPERGTVTLDGTDLRRLRLDALRGRVAMVAQETFLFNDTLEANIRLARPEATAAEIADAVRLAALDGFVAALPDGLATRVGERGVQLSGGQRQRIAIARAFLKDAPVLVLDEATSSLDAVSEAQVRAALDGLMHERTTLVIAHRLSTIRSADEILVLDHGEIVERGTHADLLRANTHYARLLASQVAASSETRAV